MPTTSRSERRPDGALSFQRGARLLVVCVDRLRHHAKERRALDAALRRILLCAICRRSVGRRLVPVAAQALKSDEISRPAEFSGWMALAQDSVPLQRNGCS